MTVDITDPRFLTRLANRVIPIDAAASIRVTAVEDRRTWQYDTILFDSIWADNVSIPLVLRYYRSPITLWQTRDPHKCDREWAVLRRLRLDGFPAPRPLARGETDSREFIIWQKPAGQTWRRSDRNLAAQARAFIPQLAGLLAALHSLNPNSLNNEPLYHATVAGSLVRMLLWSREMGDEDLRRVIRRLKPAVAGLKSWSPRLLHGRPHPDNVLVAANEITTLINWDYAAIGDPRWDVMTAAHWLRQIDPAFGEQLVNWYETFTGHTIDDRPFWWAMVSVRLWAIKAWADHAARRGLVPDGLLDWTGDLPQVKARAFDDLANVGL